MKKVIVTGFTGYIAGNLIPKLIDKGYYVRGYDRRVPEEYYFDGDYFPTITDISKGIYQEDDIVGIIHLAAISGIAKCEENVTDTMKSNIESTLNIFNYAYEIGVPVIFASSQAAENGGNLYADTKKICEEMAQIYNEIRPNNVRVLRFANVYGGKDYLEKKNTALSSFIRCRLNGETAIIHGSGYQYRDFVHVNDVCDAIIKALEYKGDILHPIDIGTGINTSILHLAKNIVQCNYIIRGDIDPGVDGNVANNRRSREILGFKAQRNIKNIMEEYENV